MIYSGFVCYVNQHSKIPLGDEICHMFSNSNSLIPNFDLYFTLLDTPIIFHLTETYQSVTYKKTVLNVLCAK